MVCRSDIATLSSLNNHDRFFILSFRSFLHLLATSLISAIILTMTGLLIIPLILITFEILLANGGIVSLFCL